MLGFIKKISWIVLKDPSKSKLLKLENYLEKNNDYTPKLQLKDTER